MKQRLIGAAVLLALGVIFIPMILDGGGNPVLRKIPPIPQVLDAVDPQTLVIPSTPPALEQAPKVVHKPEQEATPQAAATAQTETVKAVKKAHSVQPGSKSKAAASATDIKPDAVTPQAKTPPAATTQKQAPTALAAASSPEKIRAWTVQVGSFNTSNKALKLRGSLRAKGFKAYVEKISKQNQAYYRVRVGPVLNKKDANKLLKKLKKNGQTSAYVVRHP